MDRAESAESNRNRASIFERFAGLTHDENYERTKNATLPENGPDMDQKWP